MRIQLIILTTLITSLAIGQNELQQRVQTRGNVNKSALNNLSLDNNLNNRNNFNSNPTTVNYRQVPTNLNQTNLRNDNVPEQVQQQFVYNNEPKQINTDEVQFILQVDNVNPNKYNFNDNNGIQTNLLNNVDQSQAAEETAQVESEISTVIQVKNQKEDNSISAPSISAPTLNLPKINLPKISLPSINVSKSKGHKSHEKDFFKKKVWSKIQKRLIRLTGTRQRKFNFSCACFNF